MLEKEKIRKLRVGERYTQPISELKEVKQKKPFAILHKDNHVTLARIVELNDKATLEVIGRVEGKPCPYYGFNYSPQDFGNNLCYLAPEPSVCFMDIEGLGPIGEACPRYLAFKNPFQSF